ncbi:FAD-dependent oxidoreductase, partial [Sphingobium yanoikuyae]
NGNWPREVYVREARRMVSDFVMAEPHLRGTKATPRPVGMGSYNMDSHNVRRIVDARGFARNEGNIEVSPERAYPISYDAIIPKRQEATNLLVPVALSASHIAYGSIRMEPVFMILGQSAAAAASIAIREGRSVQDVDYGMLKQQLLSEQQILALER